MESSSVAGGAGEINLKNSLNIFTALAASLSAAARN
jgi:hypothetical protein